MGSDSATISFNYDNNGNLLSKELETVADISVDPMTIRPGFGSFVSGQDVVGESSLENSYARYTYNNFNQMVAAQIGDARSEYKYNGAGVRTYKEVGGVKTYSMYQGLKAIYEVEVDGLTRDASVNMYAGNKLVSVFASGTETKLLYDGLGSVVGYYDVGVNDYGDYRTYNAFGELEENGIANDTLDIGYRGYQLDAETELYNLNARMYDADLARFMQEDTYLGKASDPLSLNLYAYVSSNPLRYWDPTGRILTEWDKENLSLYERNVVERQTRIWENINKRYQNETDPERKAWLKDIRDGAHDEAEKMRNRKRAKNEVGSVDGFTHTVTKVKNKVHVKINEADKGYVSKTGYKPVEHVVIDTETNEVVNMTKETDSVANVGQGINDPALGMVTNELKLSTSGLEAINQVKDDPEYLFDDNRYLAYYHELKVANQSNKNGYLIALDNGHGIDTPGKRTPIFEDGPLEGDIMHEWEFNYAVVQKMDYHLNRLGFDTVLVSDTPDNTALSDRTRTAINAGADMFISVHANALYSYWRTDDPTGIETFIYKEGGNAERLANLVQTQLIEVSGLPDRGVKEANFQVIRQTYNAGIPAILTESGFMDSRYDANLLISDEYRESIAIAHVKGICQYYDVGVKSKFITAP